MPARDGLHVTRLRQWMRARGHTNASNPYVVNGEAFMPDDVLSAVNELEVLRSATPARGPLELKVTHVHQQMRGLRWVVAVGFECPESLFDPARVEWVAPWIGQVVEINDQPSVPKGRYRIASLSWPEASMMSGQAERIE